MGKIKPKKDKQAENFAKNAPLQESSDSEKESSGKEYPDAISVRMTEDMAETIRAIAYYERIPQREVIEKAINLFLSEKDPKDIKEALRLYDQKK